MTAIILQRPKRIRSVKYLNHIRGQPCLLSLAQRCSVPGEAHHLTFAQPRAMALKTGDQWTVPVCHLHHMELHAYGDERTWWALLGIDAMAWAEREWEQWLDEQGEQQSDRAEPQTE